MHGVPEEIVAGTPPFFDYIIEESTDFTTDRVLADGDSVEAGGLTLRVVFRPGHSTTDTLFVDDDHGEAFVGDHLLANITSGAEIMPTELPGDERRRALLEYLANLRKTEVMQLATCYPGHGPTIARSPQPDHGAAGVPLRTGSIGSRNSSPAVRTRRSRLRASSGRTRLRRHSPCS